LISSGPHFPKRVKYGGVISGEDATERRQGHLTAVRIDERNGLISGGNDMPFPAKSDNLRNGQTMF
jgi:hypothetical protein